MKKIIFVLFAITAVVFTSVNAQNPQDLAGTEAVQEATEFDTEITDFPEDRLRSKMTDLLNKNGKYLGMINDDGSVYVVASASTQQPSNMPGFINSRNVAFSIAELTAKMNLLRLAGEQITSGRGFTMLEDIMEGEDPDASAQATKLQKASILADKSLDKALGALGVADDKIKSMNEPQKKAVYSQTYNQTISSLVAGMLKGCSIVKVVEGEVGNDDYQVAVCVKYSPEYQSLASAIQARGNYPSATLKKSPDPSEKIRQLPINEMIAQMGTKVMLNQNGEMVVFGFGQQEVRTTTRNQSAAFSRANSQARLRAVNNIKNFAAEDIQALEIQQDVEKSREYADGTNAYFSSQKWQMGIESKATSLNLATKQVHVWKAKHPVSGHNIAGVVVMWSPSTDVNAKQMKEHLNAGPKTEQQKKDQIRQKTKRSEYMESTLGDEDI